MSEESEEYAARLIGFLPTEVELEEFAESPSSVWLLNAFNRMVTWFRLLHSLRSNHETSVLLAAAHSKVIETWVLLPLGLLHSSYTALRTVVDICTSYTFYYSHPIEWRSVCDDSTDWESRAAIIDWHSRYTRAFREMNRVFGLRDALNQEYRELSSYIHGVPVSGLPTLKGIARTSIFDDDLSKFTQIAERVDSNLNRLYLSVFHGDLSSLSANDFKTITGGIDRRKLASVGIVLPRV